MDPVSFEYSSLRKLQVFAENYTIEENRYLSSPGLMKFRENILEDETMQDNLNVWDAQPNLTRNASYESEDEEFIDIESVPNCSVTSTTDKVSKL